MSDVTKVPIEEECRIQAAITEQAGPLRTLTKAADEIERLLSREQQLQRALAFWHPGVRVDDVPEAATKRAADDACLLYGLEEADEQSATDLGWVAWVVPGEFARLRSRLAEADANAPWLTQAHILCSDHGIPHGNISDRLEMLAGYLAEAERDAARLREAIQHAADALHGYGVETEADAMGKACRILGAAMEGGE